MKELVQSQAERRRHTPRSAGRPNRHRSGTLSPIRDSRSTLERLEFVFGIVLTVIASVAPRAQADESAPSKRPAQPAQRFGVFFWHDSPNDDAAFAGIRAALGEIGRKDELIVRQAGSDPDVAKRILGEFRELELDLIFAMGTQASLIAKRQIDDIPIVFTAVTNPVESGVTPSWNGSRANLAGNSNWIPPETLLYVFRLTVPELGRLGVLRSRDGVVSGAELRSLRAHTKAQGDPLQVIESVVEREADLERAVDDLVRRGVEAIWIPIDRLVYSNTAAVFKAARAHGIPIVSSSLRGTRSGATSGVVIDYVMLGKRAAAIALEVLGGRPPGSVPVGTMRGYRVVVNLEAARQSHYEIPLSLLVLADILLERIDTDDDSERK